MIAYTDGAEDFVDNNGNSVYDANDGNIIDLTEPYADENENNSYDLGEFFFDTNRNGVWDSGNGEWDGPCLVEVDSSAVCDGESTVSIFDTVTIVLSTDVPRLKATGTFGNPGLNINLTEGTSRSFSGIVVSDSNSNADSLGRNPMPKGTTVEFSYEGDGVTLLGATSFTVPNTTVPSGPYGATLVAGNVELTDTLPTPGQLVLTITPPDAAPSQFTWNVAVNR